MSEPKVPYAWVGQRVEALVIQPWGKSDTYGIPSSRSLTAWIKTGLLESVNDLGIVATFEEGDEPALSAFYPWNAVLSLRVM